MKYKVGDKVKVRLWDDMVKEFGLNKSDNINCELYFLKFIKGYCEKIVTIDQEGIYGNYYTIKEDGIPSLWLWLDDMFEDVNKEF